MNFEIDDGNSMISFASMLVSTNDAFIGSNHLDVSKSRTMMLNAYDSGTEVNSEDCAYIPGPPCGNHRHDPAEAEGICLRPPRDSWRRRVGPGPRPPEIGETL